MARGWESKSVEEQMANALENPGAVPGNGLVSDEDRRAAEQQRAAREREKQALSLQRENILSQRTSNPGRRAALEAALAQVESQIQAMS
jgi:ribosomal protein L12E/L44/L45/RPP1/RPP2